MHSRHLMKDAHGNPLEVVGSWSEVTARKTAEQAALQASEQRLNDAIAAISEGFSLYDTEDRLVLGNYKFIFTGAQSVEIASNRKKLTVFFSDTEKLLAPMAPIFPCRWR